MRGVVARWIGLAAVAGLAFFLLRGRIGQAPAVGPAAVEIAPTAAAPRPVERAEVLAILDEIDRVVSATAVPAGDGSPIQTLRDRGERLNGIVERLSALGPGAVPHLL